MAAKTARPGRTLIGFFTALAIAFGLVALTGTWKPELGLDLQGGTSIRLIAEGEPTPESLEEARKIIDQRVNGSGVAEAEVTVQGNRFIVVEIPGSSRADLEETGQAPGAAAVPAGRLHRRGSGRPAAPRPPPRDPHRGRAGRGRGRPDRDPDARCHGRGPAVRRSVAVRRRLAIRQRQPGPGELRRRDPVRRRPPTSAPTDADRRAHRQPARRGGRRATHRSRSPRAARTSATR